MVDIEYREFQPDRRIEASLTSSAVLGQVFNSEEIGKMEKVLIGSAKKYEISAGGRRVRELLGCKTIDVAGSVAKDVSEDLPIHDLMRIFPIVQALKKYPDVRKTKPDCDFYVAGRDVQKPNLKIIAELAESNGLKTEKLNASGNIEILEVFGENGSATFIDSDESWQTQWFWPKYAVKAQLSVNKNTPSFNLNCSWNSMYVYPLELPGMAGFDQLDPRRVAAVGRSLLWQVLSTDPSGNKLKEPSLNTQRAVEETVSLFPALLKTLEKFPIQEGLYASGVRDMALALRIIVLNDQHTDYMRNLQSIVQSKALVFAQPR